LKNFITLSGRRWNPHGSSKEGSGKEAGSKKASQEGGSKEEIIFTLPNTFLRNFSLLFINPYGYPVLFIKMKWIPQFFRDTETKSQIFKK
jgi:hypothetical protein